MRPQIKIDRWVELYSPEAKELDDNRPFTMKVIRMGFEDGWLYTDKEGKIYGRDPSKPDMPPYPLHFEGPNNQLIGYRISSKAAN